MKKTFIPALLLFIISCSNDPQLVVTLIGHADEIKLVVFSPNDSYIASVSKDNVLIVWSAGKYRKVFKTKVSGRNILKIVFSNDQKYLAAVTDGNNLTIWEVQSGNIDFQAVYDINSEGELISFSRDSKELIISRKDGKLDFLDLKSKGIIRTIGNKGYNILSFGYSSDGKFFSCTDSKGYIHFYKTNTFYRYLSIKSDFSNISLISFAFKNRFLIFAGEGKNICRLDIKLKKITYLLRSNDSDILQLLFDDENRILYACDEKGSIIKMYFDHHLKITSYNPCGKVYLSSGYKYFACPVASVLNIYKTATLH
jgi:WD40 repeat protein